MAIGKKCMFIQMCVRVYFLQNTIILYILFVAFLLIQYIIWINILLKCHFLVSKVGPATLF